MHQYGGDYEDEKYGGETLVSWEQLIPVTLLAALALNATKDPSETSEKSGGRKRRKRKSSKRKSKRVYKRKH